MLTDLSIEAIGELSFVPPDASILNERAQAVTSDEIASSQFKALVARMLAIAAGETSQTAAARLVGLAAPQIGIAKRVILVDTGYQGVDREREPRRLEVFINPVIIRHSLEMSTGREGCYSTGNVRGLVSRAASVVVEAIDGSGARVVTPAEGFVARVFQHEVDHLDGTRFPDRIVDDAHLHWVEPEEIGAYAKAALHWTRVCPRERWQATKAGAVSR